MKPRDVLIKAKQIIDQRGWTQGRYENSTGCVCASGAVNVAISGDAYWVPDSPDDGLVYTVMDALDIAAGRRIVTFNDAPGRTKEQVLEVFDKAIAAVSA